jgi:probable rRNA maturation factor
MAVNFFEEGVSSGIRLKNKIKRWLKKIAENKGYKIKNLNYVFCDDEYLYDINVQYLKHDTYTDIITFDQSENENEIEGDIYISIERVKENASQLKTLYQTELLRVLSHGVLHLCGYKDKTDTESQEMREEENEAIRIFGEMDQ